MKTPWINFWKKRGWLVSS